MRRSVRTTELALSGRRGSQSASSLQLVLDYGGVENPPVQNPQRVSGRQSSVKTKTESEAVWIAVWFPDIALDVLDWHALYPEKNDGPRVVFEQQRGVSRVVAVCERAFEAGISSGMDLLSAQALCDDLQVHERRQQREQEYLAAMAGRLLCFTPMVSIEAPDALLLEVRDSLKLFNGLTNLKRLLKSSLHQAATTKNEPRLMLATTSTPEASLMLARAGQVIDAQDEPVKSLLASLPVCLLPLQTISDDSARMQQQLMDVGIDSFQDLWRLPVAGLRARFGEKFTALLERIQGKAMDTRQPYRPELFFSQSLDLEMETASLRWIGAACERLLNDLCNWLKTLNALTGQLEFVFLQSDRIVDQLKIGHREGSANLQEWKALLDLYLDRHPLKQVINQVRLNSQHVYPAHLKTPDLFRQASLAGRDDWSTTLAELSVRLGQSSLCFLGSKSDYRPERQVLMSPEMPAESSEHTGSKGLRPCWLLDEPQKLGRLSNGWPAGYQRISGPERIENGWWDEGEIRRDYYVAKDSHERQLWIYRDLDCNHWCLHGLFA